MWKINEQSYFRALSSTLLYGEAGKITRTLGLIYEAHLPGAAVGSLCRIYKNPEAIRSDEGTDAEVIGFRDKRVLLMPFEIVPGINNGSLVVLKKKESSVQVGRHLLGRVIDGRCAPLDQKGALIPIAGKTEDRELYQKPSDVLTRRLIRDPLDLGVRSINGLLTCGKGQRVGIMAGSGVGKSVLLGMMARHTSADVNVIALIGERGREVREFIERDLGPEGLARSIVVVATSDQSPLLRLRAAFLATSIAEFFRDQGSDVLLMMDSITRLAMAQREIGLSMAEPPASKGYTPSVFSMLPKLLERAGTSPGTGSITGLYTVLVEGDDMDDPIADAARSILDGHIVLNRALAHRNHFPAIDVLQSASRVMPAVISKEHQEWAGQIREWMALYKQVEDLVNVGAYVKGSNPRIDTALLMHDKIEKFLRQGMHERASFAETVAAIQAMTLTAEGMQRSQGNVRQALKA